MVKGVKDVLITAEVRGAPNSWRNFIFKALNEVKNFCKDSPYCSW